MGRILDWFKASTKQDYTATTDPGVLSVTEIYHYYKKHGHATEVMGASFRNKGEITELAGCDLLTIAPSLLAELAASDEPLVRKLDPAASAAMDIPKRVYDEKTFRLELNDDAMATEKTAQGIRNFSIDIVKLEKVLSAALAAA